MPVKPAMSTDYPWRIWFNQSPVTLTKGIHYDVKTRTMMQMARNVASEGKAGVLPCKIKIEEADDEKSFTLTVVGPKDKE
jgi:hypothetical protein